MIQSSLPVAPSTKDQAGVPTLAAAQAGAPTKAAHALDFAALLLVQAAPAQGTDMDLSMPAVENLPAELPANQPPVAVAGGKTLPVHASPVADVPADTLVAPGPVAESRETKDAAVDQPTAGKTKDSGKEPPLVLADPAIASALLLPFQIVAAAAPQGTPQVAPASATPARATALPQVAATELQPQAPLATTPQNLPEHAEARLAAANGTQPVPVRNVIFIEPESINAETASAAPAQVAMAQPAQVAARGAADPAGQPGASRARAKPDSLAQVPENSGRANDLVSAGPLLGAQDTAAPIESVPERPVVAADLGATLARAVPGGASSQGPTSPAPHDFAALVDRLVEARQAIAPAAVTAAVAHSDFGRVTLNFRSEGDSLAVSMASADPTFAPAVQAAAQSFGAQSNLSDNAAGSQSRNDQGSGGPGQGFVSSQGSGQPQGQSAEQGPGQRARHASGSAEPASRPEQERPAGPDEARDIYA